MADVTGDLGGQPIQLNNAATEATLKQLLAAMLAMVDASASGKKGAKLQKELEDELKRLAKAAKSATDSLTEEQKAAKEKTEAEKKAAKKAEELAKKEEKAATDLIKGIEGLYKGVENVAIGMTNLLSTLSNVGNSLTSAANSLNAIPVVGGLVATAFGAVAGAAEKTYKSFQEAASVGANFGGSITEMINSAGSAGLTFEQFSGIIAKNGESIALLGGGANNGARRLAELGKTIRNTNLGNQLANLGYSTEQINEGFLRYSAMQAKSGNGQRLSNAELIKQTGEYLKNLDAVSKLTGKSKEALQAEEDARRRDAQFRIAERKINKEDRKNLDMFMNSMGKVEQDAFKEMLATGTLAGEASQNLMITNPKAAQAMLDAALTARKSGKFTEETAYGLDAAMTSAAKAAADKADVEVMGAFHAKEYGEAIVDLQDRAGRTTTLQEERSKQAAEAAEKERIAREKGLEALSPEKLKTAQEQIAQIGNQFTAALANSGLLDQLIPAFKMLADITAKFILPAFTGIGEHATLAGVVLGGVAIALGTMNAIVAIGNTLEAAKNINLALASAGLGRFTASLFAPVAGLFKFAAGLLAAMAPLWPLAVVAGALYAGWKLLENAGYSLSDVLEAVGDNLKRFGLFYVDIWLSIAEKVAKFFGGGDKIAAMRQRIALEQSELDEKEKARDQRRKQNREEAAQKTKEIDASKKLTESKEEENKQTEKAVDTTVDYKNTYSVLHDEFKKRNQQPGAVSATPGGPAGPVSMPSAAPADIQKYLQATALVESGGNANARAGTSSAGGMFQFVDATWKQMVKEMGKDYSLQDKFDPKKSAEVMAYFTQKQKGQLEKGIGRQASNTDLYMSHFLGAGGATKFLNAMQQNPSQSAAMLDPAAAKANKSIYYDPSGRERSLQEVYSLMGKKMGGAEQALASGKWGGKAIPAEVLALGGGAGVPGATQVQGALAAGAPSGRPATPVSANLASADSLRMSMEKEAEIRRQAALKQQPSTTEQGLDIMKKRMAGEKPSMPGTQPVQETAETLLASLNTKMDQLIQISSRLGEVNERQLSVQRGLGKDAYAV